MENQNKTNQKAEQAKFLDLLCDDNQVHEIRVINKHEVYRQKISSIYFKSTPEGKAQAIQELNQLLELYSKDSKNLTNTYVLMNPCKDELYFRKNSSKSTSDSDIIKRTRLLIDVDSDKADTDIMASKEEYDKSAHIAAEVQKAFDGLGFPRPIVSFTGNGWALIYKIDLEINENNEKAIEEFYDAICAKWPSVDIKVKNKARVTRFIGTKNEKGRNEEPREHRYSRFIKVPDQYNTLSIDLVKKATQEYAPETEVVEAKPKVQSLSYDGEWDASKSEAFVEKLLDDSHTNYTRQDKGSKVFYHLDECPVVAGCTADGIEISIIVMADGMIGYENMHDRGDGVDWKQVRAALESKAGYSKNSKSLNPSYSVTAASLSSTPEDKELDPFESCDFNNNLKSIWSQSNQELKDIAYFIKQCSPDSPDSACIIAAHVTVAQLASKRILLTNEKKKLTPYYTNVFGSYVGSSGDGKSDFIEAMAYPANYHNRKVRQNKQCGGIGANGFLTNADSVKKIKVHSQIGTGLTGIYRLICGRPIEQRIGKPPKGQDFGVLVEDYIDKLMVGHEKTLPLLIALDESSSALIQHVKFRQELFNLLHDGDANGTKNAGDNMTGGSYHAYGHAVNITCTAQYAAFAPFLDNSISASNGVLGRFIFFCHDGKDKHEFKVLDENAPVISKARIEQITDKILAVGHHAHNHHFGLYDQSKLPELSEKLEHRIKPQKFYVNAQRLAGGLKLIGYSDEVIDNIYKAFIPILMCNAYETMRKSREAKYHFKSIDDYEQIEIAVRTRMKSMTHEITVRSICTDLGWHKSGDSETVKEAISKMNITDSPYCFNVYSDRSQKRGTIKGLILKEKTK